MNKCTIACPVATNINALVRTNDTFNDTILTQSPLLTFTTTGSCRDYDWHTIVAAGVITSNVQDQSRTEDRLNAVVAVKYPLLPA